MTKKLIPTANPELLPVICTCQEHHCKQKYEVTEISDFTIKKLYEADREVTAGTDEIIVICDICGGYAFPPAGKREALITAYKVWKKTGAKPKSSNKWSKNFRCPECEKTSEINEHNLTWGSAPGSANYGGEHPTIIVKIVCPVCESRIPAHGHIPSGIETKVLIKAKQSTD